MFVKVEDLILISSETPFLEENILKTKALNFILQMSFGEGACSFYGGANYMDFFSPPHMYIYMHTDIYMCIYIHPYIYVYAYMNIYLYIYLRMSVFPPHLHTGRTWLNIFVH